MNPRIIWKDQYAQNARLIAEIGTLANSERSAIFLEGYTLGLKDSADLFCNRPREKRTDPYSGKEIYPGDPCEASGGPQ